MNKLTNNIAVKIFAIFMSFVVFFGFLISVLGIGFMLFNDFYTLNYNDCRDRIIGYMADKELYNLIEQYEFNSENLEKYYSYKNIFYYIETQDENVYTNFNGSDIIVSVATTHFVDEFYDQNGKRYDAFDVGYYTVNGNTGWYSESNVPLIKSSKEANFSIYIPDKMNYTDSFYIAKLLLTFGYNNKFILIFYAVVSLIFGIVIYSFIFITVGHSKDNKTIHICKFNKLPSDIMTVFTVSVFVLSLILLSYSNAFITALTTFLIIAPVLYFVMLWYIISIAVQIKGEIVIKNSAIYFFVKQLTKLFKAIKYIFKNMATAYKTAFILIIMLILQLLFIGLNFYENDNLIIGWLILSIIISIVLLFAAIAFGRVKRGGEKIVAGDLDSKIDTEYMFGDIKNFAESLNNINNGLQVAINDKIKSERFKTELITNVSHDIKTPLTSIVNYVDLIKKEDCDNKKINEYIEVLERQSSRLKKLIEDLVEASKASTGNISVELAKCNLSVLINQAVGEFSEKLEKNNLTVVQSIENQEIFVMADGRRLWRVFDNLLNNICKYALKGTRVYIDLVTEDNKAVITFKNISSTQLTILGDDLTERFVRGDRARNTEGSGLGLSIAKSLTILQNGTFKIEIDGDLFKAIITFNLIK